MSTAVADLHPALRKLLPDWDGTLIWEGDIEVWFPRFIIDPGCPCVLFIPRLLGIDEDRPVPFKPVMLEPSPIIIP